LKELSSETAYSIMILNYNGEDFLERCVQHSLRAMERYSCPGEVLVVDNASSDSSLKILTPYSDRLKLISMESNKVLCAYNEAVKQARGDIIILLNNDEYIDEGFLEPLLSPFRNDPNLFLVVPKTVDEGTQTYQAGLLHLEFKKGHFWLKQEFSEQEKSTPSQMNIGCLGAYRKEIFEELEGFEPLFLPYYWEDADLAYRAAKSGWNIHFEPRAITEHLGQATISRFIPAKVRKINRRNKILFFYLNATDPLLWLQHWLLFPFFLLRTIFIDRTLDYLQGWFWIIQKLPRILEIRVKRTQKFQKRDADLLNLK